MQSWFICIQKVHTHINGARYHDAIDSFIFKVHNSVMDDYVIGSILLWSEQLRFKWPSFRFFCNASSTEFICITFKNSEYAFVDETKWFIFSWFRVFPFPLWSTIVNSLRVLSLFRQNKQKTNENATRKRRGKMCVVLWQCHRLRDKAKIMTVFCL